MKYILFALLLFSGVASAQFTPTGSKTRFVNGIGLGSKLDAAFGTADSLVLYTKLDSTLMFKYKGTARALAYASDLGIYKLKSDSLFDGGFTTRNTTKKIADSLAIALNSKIAVSVKDYGAMGDSTTDDYTAITNAIAASISNGTYWVVFPLGKYKVSATINVPSFVKLSGVTIRRPIIFGSFSGTLVSLNGEGIRLENLLIDQAGALAGSAGRTGNAIDIIGTNSVNTSWTQLSSIEAISNNKVINIDASTSSTQRGDIALYNSAFFHYGASDTGFVVKNTRYVSIVNSSLFAGGSSSGCKLYSDANSPFLKISSNSVTGTIEVNGQSSSFYGANFGSSVTINSKYTTLSGGSTSGNITINSDSCIAVVSLIGTATITDNGTGNSIYSRYSKTQKLGIGKDPSQYLDILIPSGVNDGILVTNANTYNNWHGVNSSNVGFVGSTNGTPLQLQTNGTAAISINTSQIVSTSSRLNVNGATDNASYALNVSGAANISGNSAIGGTLGVTGDAQYNSNISALGSISVGTTNFISGSQIYNYKNGEAGLRLHGNTTTDNAAFGTINFGNTNDISGGYLTARIKAVKQTYDNGADLVFETATAASTPTERMRIGFTGLVTVAGLGTGTLYTNSGVLTNTNPSDSSLKDSIMPMRYGLAEVLKLKPKTFYYKSDSAHTVKYGFIAQEVKPIMPDIVRKIDPKDPKSKLGLETDGIYVTLVKAIQEQQTIIDDLKKRILALENK